VHVDVELVDLLEELRARQRLERAFTPTLANMLVSAVQIDSSFT
jgi:hypothetical protein